MKQLKKSEASAEKLGQTVDYLGKLKQEQKDHTKRDKLAQKSIERRETWLEQTKGNKEFATGKCLHHSIPTKHNKLIIPIIAYFFRVPKDSQVIQP